MSRRKPWRPLVYLAPQALTDAHRVMGDNVVPENVIADALVSGHVACGRVGRVWDPDGRWVAHVERVPGRVRRRPLAWLVNAVNDQPAKEEACP
jgi:hypothetical protein